MSYVDFSVLPSHAVELALATTKVDCQITAITVWLKTLLQLSDSVAYVNDNNLQGEIFARAGVADTTYFNLIVQQEATTEGPYFIYKLRMSHSDA